MFDKDTIAIISSPQGQGAISIIRVSGDKTHNIVEKIFRPKLKQKKYSDLKVHKNYLGIIQDEDEIIDEVIICKLKKPNSFTGEDMVEIYCHGSIYIQNRIMQLLCDSGIRTANPGEFSLRSYLNGKMDLIQAEGISDLIASNSKTNHKLAMNQMRGGVSSEIKKMRDKLLNLASLIELELDFSQEDIEFASRDKFLSLLNNIEKYITELVDSFKYGNALKAGIPVSIVGSPNVGKSTLLNSILNEEKAITSPIAGTTRDIIEDKFNLKGILFRFIDTAGIRKTKDEIEKIGISRTFESINKSEIVLYLIDLASTDRKINLEINEFKKLKNKYKEKVIILIFTKADLIKKDIKKTGLNSIFMNTKKKKDVTYLKDIIIENLNQNFSSSLIITNSRHYTALSKAKKEINNVKGGLKNNVPSDLLTIDLKQVLYHLGEVTGEVTNDDILSNIFSKFCIGK